MKMSLINLNIQHRYENFEKNIGFSLDDQCPARSNSHVSTSRRKNKPSLRRSSSNEYCSSMGHHFINFYTGKYRDGDFWILFLERRI